MIQIDETDEVIQIDIVFDSEQQADRLSDRENYVDKGMTGR